MFFPPGDLGREEIIQRLRFIKPATSFRSAYAYDNLLYIAAGQLIPAVTGKSWDDFVRDRIFTPLGMTNTFTDVAALRKGKDVAIPHNDLSGKLQALPQEDMDTSAPAGASSRNVGRLFRRRSPDGFGPVPPPDCLEAEWQQSARRNSEVRGTRPQSRRNSCRTY